MKNLSFFIASLLLANSVLFAQVSINTDNSLPDNSAMLDVKSSNKGFLPPRMTHAELNTILNPAAGLIVFCTDCSANGTNTLIIYMNGSWNTLEVNCNFPQAPSPGIHIPSATQIIWNWNAVPGATGYKWNTTNDYSSAVDLGTETTKTESDLTCNTVYIRYIWAYKTCGYSTATSLSQTTSVCGGWLCGQPITDSRDGKIYNTVLIGAQCWFSQNLNVGTMIDGFETQTENSIIEKYCYDDLATNCAVYGGLYQWDELMQYDDTEGIQGLCPTGWHLPTDAEWTTLTSTLGGESVAGGEMKETGYTHWLEPNTGATNNSGFTALPGGFRDYYYYYFYYLTYDGIYWSSSQNDLYNAWIRHLYYDFEDVYRNFDDKNSGFSARCLKN
jgi:uncharacterized protein (TIGR02145 family)